MLVAINRRKDENRLIIREVNITIRLLMSDGAQKSQTARRHTFATGLGVDLSPTHKPARGRYRFKITFLHLSSHVPHARGFTRSPLIRYLGFLCQSFNAIFSMEPISIQRVSKLHFHTVVSL